MMLRMARLRGRYWESNMTMMTGYIHLGARSIKAVTISRYLAQIVSLDKLLDAFCSNTKTLASISRTRCWHSIFYSIWFPASHAFRFVLLGMIVAAFLVCNCEAAF